MKKTLSFVLMCSIFAMFLTGCGNNMSRKEYTIATANKTGVY